MFLFITPDVLLAQMLQAEARQEAFYAQFPHLLCFLQLYNQVSTPIKLTLITLVRPSKLTASSGA